MLHINFGSSNFLLIIFYILEFFVFLKAKLQIGGYGERLCQANRIKLITSSCIPIQIDGEPTKLGPSIIEIFHKNQATMLEHKKKQYFY